MPVTLKLLPQTLVALLLIGGGCGSGEGPSATPSVPKTTDAQKENPETRLSAHLADGSVFTGAATYNIREPHPRDARSRELTITASAKQEFFTIIVALPESPLVGEYELPDKGAAPAASSVELSARFEDQESEGVSGRVSVTKASQESIQGSFEFSLADGAKSTELRGTFVGKLAVACWVLAGKDAGLENSPGQQEGDGDLPQWVTDDQHTSAACVSALKELPNK